MAMNTNVDKKVYVSFMLNIDLSKN